MSDSHLTEERQLINWSGDSNLPMCKPARWAIAEIVRLRAELQAANLQGIDWQSACGKAEEDHYAAREQVEQLKKQLDAAEKLIHNLTSDGTAAYFKEKIMNDNLIAELLKAANRDEREEGFAYALLRLAATRITALEADLTEVRRHAEALEEHEPCLVLWQQSQ